MSYGRAEDREVKFGTKETSVSLLRGIENPQFRMIDICSSLSRSFMLCCFFYFSWDSNLILCEPVRSRLKSKKARAIIAVKSNSLHSRTEKCIFHSQPIRRDQITFQLNRTKSFVSVHSTPRVRWKKRHHQTAEQISRKWINYTPKKNKSELN